MAKLDRDYVQRQRERLLALRKELSVATPAEVEEGVLNSAEVRDTREIEEDAQRLATLEVDARLVARDLRRRGDIERALKKIEEGTYGLSDDSGEPIAKERLDNMPEAIYSVADEEMRERRSRVSQPQRA